MTCIQNKDEVYSIYNMAWSTLCASVVNDAVIHICNIVWIDRNSYKFKDKFVKVSSLINYILVAYSLYGNNENATSHINMQYFIVLKNFKVRIWPPKAHMILETIW